MNVFKSTKIELLFFFALALCIFFAFKVDIDLYNYFQNLNDFKHRGNLSLKNVYFEWFFVKITKLGSASWYISFLVILFITVFIIKKLKIIKRIYLENVLNFILSVFVYLLICGLVTQIIKFIVGRARPNHASLDKELELNYFVFDSQLHSFPSGHSSTIFILSLLLSSVLPGLKYFFFLFATIIAFSRVVVGAHFLSDILAGCLLAFIMFKVVSFFLNKYYERLVLKPILINNNKGVYYSLIVFVLYSLLVTISSHLDLFVSGIFYLGKNVFYLQSYYLVTIIFREILLPFVLVCLLIIPFFSKFTLVKKFFFGHTFKTKEVVFIWLSQILCLGIIVNFFLKTLWGRARPGDVIQFGGDGFFTPWYKISNSCDSNCSFVSGDSSVGFSLIILYFITKNIFFIYASIFMGLSLGLIRIMEGAHFLSDIIFAGIIVILFNLLFYQIYNRYYGK